MNKKIQCANPDCGRIFDANPRAKNQSYCGEKPCQRGREIDKQGNGVYFNGEERKIACF